MASKIESNRGTAIVCLALECSQIVMYSVVDLYFVLYLHSKFVCIFVCMHVHTRQNILSLSLHGTLYVVKVHDI